MATVTATQANSVSGNPKTLLVTWTPLTTTNADGEPLVLVNHIAKAMQVTGTFGSGGTVIIEGSMDGTNYYTLNNLQGTAISITGAKIQAIQEVVKYIRPKVSTGDGTTSITAILLAHY